MIIRERWPQHLPPVLHSYLLQIKKGWDHCLRQQTICGSPKCRKGRTRSRTPIYRLPCNLDVPPISNRVATVVSFVITLESIITTDFLLFSPLFASLLRLVFFFFCSCLFIITTVLTCYIFPYVIVAVPDNLSFSGSLT